MRTALCPVVVDTNVIFSSLLSTASGFARVILGENRRFVVCEHVFLELFKHKAKILRASGLDEDHLLVHFGHLLGRLELYNYDRIPSAAQEEAESLCSAIDPSDSPHVALALHLHGLLWTGDKRLKEKLRATGFSRFYTPVIVHAPPLFG